MKTLGFVALLLLSGCKTEITFRNEVPNASIENVRWVSGNGTSYAPESTRALLPGEESEAVAIVQPDEDTTGRLHFELVVGGRKVALESANRFTAQSNTTTTFTLRPDTFATNSLASSPSGDPLPANP